MSKTRRDFLKELGATATLLPILPSLMSSRAEAAIGQPPKRIVIFWGFNGVHDSAFWPTDDPPTMVAPNVYSSKISDIIAKRGQTSPIFGPSFNALANKFSIIRGMGQCVSPYGVNNIVHDAASVFSLAHIHENSDAFGAEAPVSGSSMDCIIENSKGFYQSAPALTALRLASGDPKLNFSFWRPNGGSDPTYDQVASQQVVSDDPAAIFKKLFGSSPLASAAPAYRRQVFENVLNQFNSLSKSTVVSSADSQRLIAHAAFLAKIRDSSGVSTGLNCTANSLSSGTSARDRLTNNFNSIAAAFACDVTRVVCYTLDTFDDNGKVSWDDDHTNSHQDLTQNGAPGSATDYLGLCAKWRGWQADRIADFMTKLDSLKEIDGSSVLDNTIIIWANQHGSTHCISNYPLMIGGGLRGQFRMGEYVDYRTRPNQGNYTLGQPLSSLWMPIMRALGVPAADYLKQGEQGAFGQAMRAGDQYSWGYSGALATMRQQMIPYFYTGGG